VARARRLKMEAVLYKGGGQAVADTVAGHVPCYFGNLNELIPHAGSGRVRILATSGAQRAPQLPNVPTVAEQGYPGFRTLTWNGYVAPAGTPREIVERIARELGAACKDAAFAARLDKIGVDPVCGSPAEFSQAIREDLQIWKEAVQAAGINEDRDPGPDFPFLFPAIAAVELGFLDAKLELLYPSPRPTRICATASWISSAAPRTPCSTRSRTGRAENFCAPRPAYVLVSGDSQEIQSFPGNLHIVKNLRIGAARGRWTA